MGGAQNAGGRMPRGVLRSGRAGMPERGSPRLPPAVDPHVARSVWETEGDSNPAAIAMAGRITTMTRNDFREGE